MNKKAFGIAIASLFSLITITGCDVEAKANGKNKSDYDLTNNIELSAYYDHEIVYDDVTYKVVKEDDDDEINYRFVISSNNPNIKTYDIVEVYTIRVDGEWRKDIVTSPVTFEIDSTSKKAYIDLGCFYVDEWYQFDKYNKELRIIGESINFTYHLWGDYHDHANGKKIDDYDLSNNIVREGNYKEKIYEKFYSLSMNVGVEISRINQIDISKYLVFDIAFFADEDNDVVQIYATDANNENKKILFDDPFTIGHVIEMPELHLTMNSFGYATICLDDLPEDYYALCNQNVRFHIVTNRFTFILQTYDYIINGKTKDDYDLTNLIESDGCASYEPKYGDVCLMFASEDKNIRNYYFMVHTYCDSEINKICVTFQNYWSENKVVESLDVIEAYLSDMEGNNIKYCLTTPVTLYKYNNEEFRLKLEIDDSFEEYYALCKNNMKLHVVTNLGIIHIDLVDSHLDDEKLYGEFIDAPFDSYSDDKNSPVRDVSDFFLLNEEDKIAIKLEQNSIFGLPYAYEIKYKDYGSSTKDYPIVDIFDMYFTDESGNNKIQCIDKVYRYRISSKETILFKVFAPEYSYYLNCNKKVLLHVYSTLGNFVFHL